jgi:hypothetical protein
MTARAWSILRVRSSLFAVSVLIIAALLFSSQLALAQFTQQGPKLVGTDVVGRADQGYSVALSADGNTAIVGGYFDNNTTGAAWVYTRSNGVWTQQGSKLVGTGAVGNAYQGTSVSLAADGNTAIVGGYNDNNGTGAAWVYTRSNGIWTQQGGKLVGTGAVGPIPVQGSSVALSADGNTAIMGGYQDNGALGAAWVFTRSNGVWTQQGTKLVGTGASGDAAQGYSVALSGDGNTAIVGGNSDNSGTGAAWVYIRNPKSFGEPGRAVPPKSANRASFLGSARAALISRLSLSMTAAGVPLGAPTPYDVLAS